MTPHNFFAKPHWGHFLHIDGLHALPLSALLAADSFLDWVAATGTVVPGPSDYAICAQSASSGAPHTWLDLLGSAFVVLMPSESAHIAAARVLLPALTHDPKPKAVAKPAHPASRDWDPCAQDDQAKWQHKRKLSVYPWELPKPWQIGLRRAAQGLPGHAAAAPAKAILKRMRQKLCQFAWFADQAGLPRALISAVVEVHLADMETRLRARPQGIRWATLRATAEDLHRFSQYLGSVSADDTRYLRMRLSRYETFEKGQDALKFQALLETGNTTLTVLDKADALIASAAHEERAADRHRLRNAGAILGLFSIAPLRTSNAELVFGKSLLWESGTWVIDIEVTKTLHQNPEQLIIPLEPEFARYIDTTILGDMDARYLPDFRAQALRSRRLLFVHPNGTRPSKTYIPRMFKTYTGNSFTTTRTMLHTDQSISRGEAGTRDAMAAAHQTSSKTAKKYQAKTVRQVAVRRVQDAMASRRAAALPPDLASAVATLRTTFKEIKDEDV